MQEKKLRGYSLISTYDGLAYGFIIARNIKEAKQLLIRQCSEWIYDDYEYYIKYYAKWDKTANIEGLSLGDTVENIDLIKRNICTTLEYAQCPICKQDDVCVSLIDDDIICCSDCEEKI